MIGRILTSSILVPPMVIVDSTGLLLSFYTVIVILLGDEYDSANSIKHKEELPCN
jgi:hypothetical protein